MQNTKQSQKKEGKHVATGQVQYVNLWFLTTDRAWR